MNTILTLLQKKSFLESTQLLINALRDNTYVFHKAFFIHEELLVFLHFKALNYGFTIEEWNALPKDWRPHFLCYERNVKMLTTCPLSSEEMQLAFYVHGEPFFQQNNKILFIELENNVIDFSLLKRCYEAFTHENHYFDNLSLDVKIKWIKAISNEEKEVDHMGDMVKYFLLADQEFQAYVKSNILLSIFHVPCDGKKYKVRSFSFRDALQPTAREVIKHRPSYFKLSRMNVVIYPASVSLNKLIDSYNFMKTYKSCSKYHPKIQLRMKGLKFSDELEHILYSLLQEEKLLEKEIFDGYSRYLLEKYFDGQGISEFDITYCMDDIIRFYENSEFFKSKEEYDIL